MKLLCPHTQEVHIDSLLGIVTFHHEDDSSCDFMNRLDVSTQTILSQKLAIDDERVLSAQIIFNTPRKLYFDEIDKKTGKDLADLIIKYIVVLSIMPQTYKDILMQSIIEEYGQNMAVNILVLSGLDCKHLVKSSSNRKVEIISSDIASSFYINPQTEQEKKQTLDDILF